MLKPESPLKLAIKLQSEHSTVTDGEYFNFIYSASEKIYWNTNKGQFVSIFHLLSTYTQPKVVHCSNFPQYTRRQDIKFNNLSKNTIENGTKLIK